MCGVPPVAASNLQAAIVQGTMLYASRLTWNGGKEVEREYQLSINRMGQASLGAFRTKPRGILAAESGTTTARALLDGVRAEALRQSLGRSRVRGDPDR